MMPASRSRHIASDREDIVSIATFVSKPQIRKVVRTHRVGSGEHAVEQHANAVHIALNRGFAAAKQLWCEIQGRAGERARRGGRLAHLPTGAEVHQNGSPVGREHHVLRLDVAVQKAGTVDGRNGVANLGADLDHLGRLERWHPARAAVRLSRRRSVPSRDQRCPRCARRRRS